MADSSIDAHFLLERVTELSEFLIAVSTGGRDEDTFDRYRAYREEFRQYTDIFPMLPDYFRNCRNYNDFWDSIKYQAATYAERRTFINRSFDAVNHHLEDYTPAFGEIPVSALLVSMGADHIDAIWRKALSRCEGDPEGAITAAKALMESICKLILDDEGVDYDEKGEDLPSLYHKVASKLNLAPSGHPEKVFKMILGNCVAVVGNLANLRNELGDAHGPGPKPVKPQSRHAYLAVNLAGTFAAFLLATSDARAGKQQS